jgi:uncharacterized protein (DUF2236 family)
MTDGIHVSGAHLERFLGELKTGTARPAEGLFGPQSITWKINRESALFLAAGRAALLQLAHPWVAAAIAQHSRTLRDPVGRFHQTFRVMFTMVFGSVEQALSASRHLHRRHEAIQGSMPESTGPFERGTRYEANDLDALRWVFATLVDSAVVAYELVLPPLAAAEREQYYAESKKIAALFGIPGAALPGDWEEFTQYVESAFDSEMLTVSSLARNMAHGLQAGAGAWLRPPFWYRALTVHLLAPRLRNDFDLLYGEREQHAAERARRWLPVVYRCVPAAVRFVGPYHESRARLLGRSKPNLLVQLSNRLWVGQPELLR